MRREALVEERLTDRFKVFRTTLTSHKQWHPQGFTILLVVEGSCIVATAHEEILLSRFDRIVVPHGLDSLEITPENSLVFLECLPPGA